ncbi:MAG TPA: lysylphosphatidylglycerol synthase transmembrane domain-containing protein [Gemmatimonadota bacterium]|nr:lysylphosphatidylglycerol synthase transmembrane domain-containing protein [Gemmatimonadota bacterium]
MKRWKTWLGIAVSAAAIWYAARGVEWGEVGRSLAGADFRLLAVVFVLAPIVNVGMRALRWRVLLLPMGRLPMSSLVSATAIGLMANNVLPARIGEFVRAYALARREGVPTGTAFGSLFVERLFDGFALVGILYALTWLHTFPAWVDTTIRIAFYLFIGLLAFQVALLWRSHRVIVLLQRISHRFWGGRFEDSIEHVVVAFVDGFRLLRSPALVAVSFLLALVQWTLIAGSFWLGLAAFDLVGQAGWEGAFFVNGVTALGVAVPSSPGFVGTFQAFVVKSLAAFGIAPTPAFTFSVGYHAANYLSVTAVGLAYFLRAGLSWREIERSEEVLERELEEEFEEGLEPALGTDPVAPEAGGV